MKTLVTFLFILLFCFEACAQGDPNPSFRYRDEEIQKDIDTYKKNVIKISEKKLKLPKPLPGCSGAFITLFLAIDTLRMKLLTNTTRKMPPNIKRFCLIISNNLIKLTKTYT